MYFFRVNTWQPLYFLLYYSLFGGIAQLVRAHGSHPWGREFESPCLHHIGASFVSLAPIFYHNQSALTPLLLLFYKKSRAAHLFGYGDFPSRLRPLATLRCRYNFSRVCTCNARRQNAESFFLCYFSQVGPGTKRAPGPNTADTMYEIFLRCCLWNIRGTGKSCGAATIETDDKTAAYRFVEALHDICKQCDIPTLSEYGIDKKDFCAAINKMADDALVSGSPSNTIKEVTKADIVEIYEKLFS